MIGQRRWRWGCLGGLLLLGLAGCGLWPSRPPLSELPPCVDDDCDCGDFIDQSLAQTVLTAYWGDPYHLDRDGNGRACERLPATAPPRPPTVPTSESPHLLLGNPSRSSPDQPNNYLLERPQYALAYSRDRKLPHWVAWHLDASWLGTVERQDDFRLDPDLPGRNPADPEDFRYSGYDRGHLLPSADRTRQIQDNSATFLMANIIPQAPQNNRGLWRDLEAYTRERVDPWDRDAYVMAGAYGEQAVLESGITVPSRLWKVIVVLDRPDSGLRGVSVTSQVIAVDMPNQDALKPSWRDYQTSIDRLEVATGYDFLSNVPDAIEAALEATPAPSHP